jgi:hypothetical protein
VTPWAVNVRNRSKPGPGRKRLASGGHGESGVVALLMKTLFKEPIRERERVDQTAVAVGRFQAWDGIGTRPRLLQLLDHQPLGERCVVDVRATKAHEQG